MTNDELNEWFKANEKWIESLAAKFGKWAQGHDVIDALQEASVSICRNPLSFCVSPNRHGFFYQAWRNSLVSLIRKRRDFVPEFLQEKLRPEPSPYERAELNDHIAKMNMCLRSLEKVKDYPGYKVLVLRYYEFKTLDETAIELRPSCESIRQWEIKAIGHLRACLAASASS